MDCAPLERGAPEDGAPIRHRWVLLDVVSPFRPVAVSRGNAVALALPPPNGPQISAAQHRG